MKNTLTQEWVTKSLAEFEVILNQMTARQNAPVLDGTPFILVIPVKDAPMAHWLVLGKPYDDQNALASSYVFRMQRTFTLCGCLSMSEESARTRAAELSKKLDPNVTFIHSRDWETSCRAEVIATMNQLLRIKPTLPVS
jgi:hypothetical protein